MFIVKNAKRSIAKQEVEAGFLERENWEQVIGQAVIVGLCVIIMSWLAGQRKTRQWCVPVVLPSAHLRTGS